MGLATPLAVQPAADLLNDVGGVFDCIAPVVVSSPGVFRGSIQINTLVLYISFYGETTIGVGFSTE